MTIHVFIVHIDCTHILGVYIYVVIIPEGEKIRTQDILVTVSSHKYRLDLNLLHIYAEFNVQDTYSPDPR